MELVGSFNQHPGSHISHLAKKWREFIESDSDEDSESRDDKDADGNHGKQSQKNIKEQKTQHCKEDRKVVECLIVVNHFHQSVVTN